MNEGFEYREEIGAAGAGQSVLAHLTARYRHSSESVWRERIAQGEVLVAGRPAVASDVLRPGQSLVWRRPPWEEPDVPLAFGILYRDDDLLAVAKPRGLPTIPNGGFLTHTLLHLVQRRFPHAAPLHRLGRGTSGLVLLARTAHARRVVSAAWREGRVEKIYRALVTGVPEPPNFSVDARIGPVPHPRLGQVYGASAGGKAALTHIRVLAVRGADSLVEARIATGRPHQIRIHLAAAGYPLVGDPLYVRGGVPGPNPALPGETGYRLHAHRLGLAHPARAERLELECGLPSDLRD
jgi:23S rRNA pseudouridine1911/1915/1917 synthase